MMLRTSGPLQTQVTLVDAPGGIRSVLFRSVVLDLTKAMPHRPIASMAQEGGLHDPRFRFSPQMVYCACEAYHAFETTPPTGRESHWNVWDPTLAFATPQESVDASLYCGGRNAARLHELSTHREKLVEFPGQVVVLSRRDDHNPFFQVANALNAWIMMRAFQWDPRNVTVIHLDAGYPSPIDTLHQKLLSPARAILRGQDLVGKHLLFSGEVMLAPFETNGPMMQHLDDPEPCVASELFRQFRNQSLHAMDAATGFLPSHDKIVVTVISRKPYSGRKLQRVWLNEDEILTKLRADYRSFSGKAIVFQSIEFAELPLQRQMQLMLETDVVIGMHGAGMVSVLWTSPGTLVLEIFRPSAGAGGSGIFASLWVVTGTNFAAARTCDVAGTTTPVTSTFRTTRGAHSLIRFSAANSTMYRLQTQVQPVKPGISLSEPVSSLGGTLFLLSSRLVLS